MTGPLADLDIALLAVFTLGAFVAVAATVLVSGHIPLGANGRKRAGLGGDVAVVLASATVAWLVVSLVFAAGGLPLAVTVISVGLAVLWAPWFADFLPSRLRYSKIGLGGAALVCILAVAFLVPSPVTV